MPLEDVVSKLRKRILNIRERKETIGEENTKAALIEPLLATLGWDTEELSEVHREYKRKSQDKPVDYALFLLREPRLFIEAKALDEDLTNRKWASQVIGYAATAGVRWCVLTDGDEYRLFNSHAEVDIEEKLFRSIRISGADEQAFAVETLALLSKEKMAENLLISLWNAQFVDRKVKAAIEDLFKNEDSGFVRLLRKKTSDLGPSEIRASLKRAAPIRIDFPVVPVTTPAVPIPISELRKPIQELSNRPADWEKLSTGKKAAWTRKARLLTAAVPVAPTVQNRPSQAPLARASACRREAGFKGWQTIQKMKEGSIPILIQAGVIQTPLNLEREYKGVHLKAVIQNNGTVTVNGVAYDSLSTAGGVARKSVLGAQWRPTFPGQSFPYTNGWTFWKFLDPGTGDLREIDVLRQTYLKSSQNSTPKE